ncbi:enoyl-CoA hydratase-related protein [Hoeflea poritis]|uniref:Enoyl-CoA hydratase-related protein n=1 Tax=Hoeflea poritis TaxID=2993659 RepID=A0ABT4VMF1_9HYPH|nr:enoyl-CoA hydratase-related protein [Hoeflea poritis]MDA4845878.1 enoyl-CoA hydratase-related protein [Hoeflea poritis]
MVAEGTSPVLADTSRDKVWLLRLNRPDKRNAISNEMLQVLADQVRFAEQSQHVRCIVISGGETCFSAGADIKEMRDAGIEAIQNRSRSENWTVLETTRIPMIAAVNGICLGGGHELAMLCDIVIASNTAVFGQPEIKLGHIPGDGATQRLRRIVGKYAAMQMILTGETVDAQQALKLGLAAEVVAAENSEDRALEIASLIARHSLKALGFAKDAVRASDELSLSAGLERERRNIALAFTTKDQSEGMSAFFEKRQPEFKDE